MRAERQQDLCSFQRRAVSLYHTAQKKGETLTAVTATTRKSEVTTEASCRCAVCAARCVAARALAHLHVAGPPRRGPDMICTLRDSTIVNTRLGGKFHTVGMTGMVPAAPPAPPRAGRAGCKPCWARRGGRSVVFEKEAASAGMKIKTASAPPRPTASIGDEQAC